MDNSPENISLKNELLAMGFQENEINIALWYTKNKEYAIQCINDINNKGRSHVPAKDYKFLLLWYWGYSSGAASIAAEKPSLEEALDFLNNHPEGNKPPEKDVSKAVEKPLPIEFPKVLNKPQQEKKKPHKNPINLALGLGIELLFNLQKENKHSEKPAKRNNAFGKIINFVEEARDNIGELYGEVSKKVRNYGENLFRDGGIVEIYARELKEQGKNFEAAFNIIKSRLIRRRDQESPRNEEIPDFSQEEIEAAIEQSREEALHQHLNSEHINEEFPIEEQFAAFEEPIHQDLNLEHINEDFPIEEQLAAWEDPLYQGLIQEQQDINEEIPLVEQDAYHEDGDYQYISAEQIYMDGNVINARPQLEILNILERYWRPKGISEINMRKIKEIKYQAGTSPESCSICMEAFIVNERLKILPCNHWFHNDCIKEWLKRSAKCPLDLLDI